MYSDIYQVVIASALTLVLTVSMPICQNVTICRGGGRGGGGGGALRVIVNQTSMSTLD